MLTYVLNCLESLVWESARMVVYVRRESADDWIADYNAANDGKSA